MGTPVSTTASANTEVTVTITAIGAGIRAKVEAIGCCFNTAPAAAKLFTLESPSGTILQRWYVTSAGPAPIPTPNSGYEGAAGEAIVLRLAADSGGAIGVINHVVPKS